jgi:TolA-binding protein
MRFYPIILLLITLATGLMAQKSVVHTMPDPNYRTAVDLYEKQKYAAAQLFFQKVVDNPSNLLTETKANAQYYLGLCALELFNPDAGFLLTRYISANPQNYKANEAWFHLGRFEYTNKKYDKAIDYFEKVKPEQLSDNQRHEFHFEMGYCQFMTNEMDKARLHFYEIKDVDNKYAAPAVYYYSHICYIQKKYETALEGFNRLRDDETFSSIVPYYITQIYFLQKKFDKVVEYAPPLLDSVVEKRMGEMARIIGESYFRLGQYMQSLPYFEKYAQKTTSMLPEDRYQIAYAFYKAGEYDQAEKYFEAIASGNTLLAQNASYHLADCYLRTNDKKNARLAFAAAAASDFNAEIKENALFNYAVATYEQSMSAFNEAVKAFEEFIKLYPYSSHSDEAYNYLGMAYLSTHNYQAAVESIDKVKKKDNNIRKALQRVAFFRGLELINSLRFAEAVDMFDRSLTCASFDGQLAARATYWKGEALYRQGAYSEAAAQYKLFLAMPGASALNEFETANYNVAYCSFNQKRYDEALDWFRRYVGLMKDAGTKNVADAYNRIGDCYFMKLSYWVAIENYEKAIALGVTNADYSLFQKAFALGLVNRQEKKITFLDQLLTSYPLSSYIDDALYEKGRAWVVQNNKPEAIVSFNKLLSDFPQSSYVPKALLQLGLIYFNTDKNTEAIASYKKVAEQYPNTADARNALNGLKTVYVDMNDVDSYFAYLEKTGQKSALRNTEQDSLSYVSAENIYMTGDCEKSSQLFKRYLQRFAGGNFELNARFYIADCYLRNNKPDSAMQGYNFVLARPHSMFTEQALSNSASIYYNRSQYDSARIVYKRLETEGQVATNIFDARVGQMRCLYRLKDYSNAIAAAKSVLTSGKLTEETAREVHYTLAKSYLESNDNTNATTELKQVAKDTKSAEGAECKYLLCKMYYGQNKRDAAEKEIFDFINKNTPFQFWLGKSFLLLSDIYVDKKDDFQASQTLQSVIDYYGNNDDGIKTEAKEKKDKLTARNASLQVPAKQLDEEVQVKENGK